MCAADELWVFKITYFIEGECNEEASNDDLDLTDGSKRKHVENNSKSYA